MVLFVFAVAFANLACEDWSNRAVRQSQATGDTIVDALEKYKADHGVYPGSLQALVPKYLKAVEQPTAGPEAWEYSCEQGGSVFGLSFGHENGPKPICYFDNHTRAWIVDDK